MAELSDAIHHQIKNHCSNGDVLAVAGDFAAALESYWLAWELLPDPQNDWEAATFILAAIGDVNFLTGDYEAGRDNLSHAMRCPNAIGNSFLHLRLGQCQFELGHHERAADELVRAYMGAGADILQSEDPKYFAFLKSVLDPPPEGW